MITELEYKNIFTENRMLKKIIGELQEENWKLNDTCMLLQEENRDLLKELQTRGDYY
jgi:hypothetical protein